jgi:hypothetical protein|tara:strand:+ start:974 stop:1147 length:174 start_codon:yes stop_codon:yes gene_type:complete
MLTSDTKAFIKGDVYGAPKKKKLKRGVYVSTLNKPTGGQKWKKIPGSFSKQLKKRTV